MKRSHRRSARTFTLNVALTRSRRRMAAELVVMAFVLDANAFFSAKKEPTAKIQNQAPSEATSRAVSTMPAPLQKSHSFPATREATEKTLFSSIATAPEGVTSNIPQADH